jgi:uncharacterized membrane protein
LNFELLNILSNSNKDIDNQKLLDYISNKMSDEEKYEFEKSLVDSDMMNDVVEGLEEFKDKKDMAALVEQLNAGLKKQLEKRKVRKLKREIKNPLWLYFTIVVLLILALIGFVIIKKILENKVQPTPHTVTVIKKP